MRDRRDREHEQLEADPQELQERRDRELEKSDSPAIWLDVRLPAELGGTGRPWPEGGPWPENEAA